MVNNETIDNNLEKKEFLKADEFSESSFKLANSNFEIGQSFHLYALIAFNQDNYELCVNRCKDGIKAIKQENEYQTLLKLLEAKSLKKLGENQKAENLVNSIITDNDPKMKKIVQNDSDLKDFISKH